MSEEEQKMSEEDYDYSSYRPKECTLYVAYLSDDVSWHILKEAFSKFGKVIKVWIAPKPSGYAIVVFENVSDAREALKSLHRKELCGRKIEVKVYKPKCRTCGIVGHKARDCLRPGRTTPLSLSSSDSEEPGNCSRVRSHGSRSESTTSDSEISSQSLRNFVHPGEIPPRMRRSRIHSKENRSKRNRILTKIHQVQRHDEVINKFQPPMYTRCSRSGQNSRILTNIHQPQHHDEVINKFQPPMYKRCSRSGQNSRILTNIHQPQHHEEVINKFQPLMYTRCSRSGQNSRILAKIQQAEGHDKVFQQFQPSMYIHCSRSGQNSRILSNVQRPQGYDKQFFYEFQSSMYRRGSRSGQKGRSFVRSGPQHCGYHHSDMFNLGLNRRNDYSACDSSLNDSFYNLSCHCSCHQSKCCSSYRGQPYNYTALSNSASCSHLMPSHSLKNKKKLYPKTKVPKEDSSESGEIQFIDRTKVSNDDSSDNDEIEFIDSTKVLDFRARRIILVDERIKIEDDLTRMALMEEMFGSHKEEILQIEKHLGTYFDDLYDEVKPPLWPVLPARL